MFTIVKSLNVYNILYYNNNVIICDQQKEFASSLIWESTIPQAHITLILVKIVKVHCILAYVKLIC